MNMIVLSSSPRRIAAVLASVGMALAICVQPTPALGVVTPTLVAHRAAPDRRSLTVPIDSSRIIFRQIDGPFSLPVFITNAGDGSHRLFVVEQGGRIYIVKNRVKLGTPFLNLSLSAAPSFGLKSGGESGLLALAFHPAYASNGQFYVMYTKNRPGDLDGSILTLMRFSVSANPDLADAASGVIVLQIDHPTYGNHNGGTLAFGGDGYLYWSTGDGGGTPQLAQDKNSLLGKILRLDVDLAAPGPPHYEVPPDNPFVGATPGLDEIWAYGLRNPYRMGFDRATGDLFIGEVGQGAWEEIDYQAAGSGGSNYGWNVMEGTHCYPPQDPETCDKTPYMPPIAEHDHLAGDCAITGGHVYRGANFPSLSGWYLYGDYCAHRLYGLYDNGSAWDSLAPVTTNYWLSSFGEDEDGELYLADHAAGIYQIRYRESLLVSGDFDGDSTSDPAKFEPSSGTVHWLESTTNAWASAVIGTDASTYVRRSDFDGDGMTDPAKFVAAANALWYLRSSTDTWQGVYMGPGSFTVLGGSDFDGDGRTDPARFDTASNALWFLKSSTGLWDGVYMGPGTYQVLSGSDYDGDETTDPALFFSAGGANALWYLSSSTATWQGVYMGPGTYEVVEASDFDGDGKTEPALFNSSSNALWYLQSSTSTWQSVYLGPGALEYVAASDFDGDGRTDPAVFISATRVLWWLKSSTGSWDGLWMGSGTYEVVN